ncbi:MAG: FprA family A-type flavoprotein [Oscillospiraceae bacterium]|nr:FprA family A-type flavoprotein [Oscillospiraceae bacterium]
MNYRNDIIYVGVNDHSIDLFEGQYTVPKGMAYNSYVILDEKIAVLDTVDIGFTDQWLANIAAALNSRTPDYLIVQHMEPDHSASIGRFLELYPEITVVGNARTFVMLRNYFPALSAELKTLEVNESTLLSLGKHELQFVMAPMVHWPEVMMTYDRTAKAFFSADAFGKFGALDIDEPWEDEARRYYIGIVGKYGVQVQALLKKAAALDIAAIYPLHGPVLEENLEHYLRLYELWSSYTPEDEGVVIAYTSVYGNTKKAVELLTEQLRNQGIHVVVHDLARTDWALAVSDAFRYNKLVLATTTYNGDIFPFMKQFIDHLTERGFKNRRVGLIENGSWAPVAAKLMQRYLEGSKGIEYAENTVKIFAGLKEENIRQIAALAEEMSK